MPWNSPGGARHPGSTGKGKKDVEREAHINKDKRQTWLLRIPGTYRGLYLGVISGFDLNQNCPESSHIDTESKVTTIRAHNRH